MFTKNECIEGQCLLLFELHCIDFPSATGTSIPIVQPSRLYRAAKLHFRLAEKLFQEVGDLFIGHIGTSLPNISMNSPLSICGHTSQMDLTSLACVHDANQMKPLSDAIRPTTFIEPGKLRDHLGLDLTIATETFQHTGSFKFRAAYNLALNVEQDEILTASSGNFGQALAYACKLLGKKCTVVMPSTSARVKIDAVRGYGATVDLVDTTKVGRSERVAQLTEQMPLAYIASAYDDKFVIEGNASIGDELASRDFDAVITPVGGGGLISGIVLGLGRNNKVTQVFGAEPLLGNDAARSLRAGEIVANAAEPMTIADGARTISLGKLNWKIIKTGVADILEVSDEKIAEAVKMNFGLANLKCEPTGALSLGAILENRDKFSGKRVCLVVSGGNVDAAVYSKLIS